MAAEHFPVDLTLGVLQWAKDFPDEQRPKAVQGLDVAQAFIPSWCRVLLLKYQPDPHVDGGCLTTATFYRYRHAVVTFYPRWFQHQPRDRQQMLIHEMVHVQMAPVHEAIDALKDHALFDGAPKAARDLLDHFWTVALESATEDMAHALNDCLMRAEGETNGPGKAK